MEWAALATWVLAVVGGTTLLFIWVRRRGPRQEREAGLRIRPSVLVSHLSLAIVGLVVWIVYVATRVHDLVWVGFDVAGITSVLGFTMFSLWLRQRTHPRRTHGAGAAEQHFPVSVVAVHGIFGIATVGLTLATALSG